MDRSLDEIVAERQRSSNRGGRRGPPPSRRGGNNNNNSSSSSSYPRDGIRKSTRDDRANLDNDWVHDRYDDDASMPRGGGGGAGYPRGRGRRDDRENRHDDRERDREPTVAKVRVDNLHYDLTEDDLFELFSRIGDVVEVKIRYDRAGRSEGVAFVNYRRSSDANQAIREFDGANAKGQPIRLTLQQQPRRDNPFDRVENPRSLFDRIEAPNDRRRSQSPYDDDDENRYRRAPRRGGAGAGAGVGAGRDRRTDTTRPAPENIDRYIPGQNGDGSRSDSRRGGRRPGERRERRPRNEEGGQKLSGGRPRKTQQELDAEMEDYWGGNTAADNAQPGAAATTAPAAQPATNNGGPEMDMMIE